MSKALAKKAINAYSGSDSNYTYDQSKTSPKRASANKYSTVSTPKSKPNQQKVSNEYQSEINKMRSTVRAYNAKTSGGNARKTGFSDYSKYEDSGGRYGYHSDAQKKKWNGGYSPHSEVANSAMDVRFVDEYPHTKKVSAYQQFLKKERNKSSKTTAMANGRRAK